MNSLIIPDTGIQLVDGSIVMIARFPGTRWIVHNGWYMHHGDQYTGWYFCSIPANTVIPVNDDDLRLLTVVSGGGCPPKPCPGPHPPCPPHPPTPPNPGHDCPVIFTEGDKSQLNRAWLVVETLAQRDKLNQYNRVIPNGKIVRVNNTGEGVAKYYRWDQASELWVEESLGFPSEKYLTKDEIATYYASKEELHAVDGKVDEVVESLAMTNDRVDGLAEQADMHSEQLDKLGNGLASLQESHSTLDTKVGKIVSAVGEMNEEIEDLKTNLTWSPINTKRKEEDTWTE